MSVSISVSREMTFSKTIHAVAMMDMNSWKTNTAANVSELQLHYKQFIYM